VSTPSTGPAAAAAALSTVDPSKPAQLSWEGPAQVRAGKSFSVALRVSSGQELRASPMLLSFEPGVLEPLSVRAGKFFGQGNFSYRVNPDGSIFVGASTSGAAPGADAELLVLTFRPIKAGATAEVRLSSVALEGEAGRAIAHAQISAFRAAIQ
jgi:general secretion pathway protein D